MVFFSKLARLRKLLGHHLVAHLKAGKNSDFITVQDGRIPRNFIAGDLDSWEGLNLFISRIMGLKFEEPFLHHSNRCKL